MNKIVPIPFPQLGIIGGLIEGTSLRGQVVDYYPVYVYAFVCWGNGEMKGIKELSDAWKKYL